MPDSNRSLAILFVDISDSTGLYESLGDAEAHRLTTECLERLKKSTSSHGGDVIKTLGDGVMSTFPDADAAVMAATSMRETESQGRLTVRSGIHVGPVIEDTDDVYGDAVNVAARLNALAESDEIVLSEEAVATLSPMLRMGTRLIDRNVLRGRSGATNIYEIAPTEADATVMSSAVMSAELESTPLVLDYRGQEYVMDGDTRKFVIGRDPSSDMVVDFSYASRQHATIERRRNRLYLVDHSRNGTYLVLRDEEPVFLRREAAPLTGTGSIALGRWEKAEQDDMISFRETSGA